MIEIIEASFLTSAPTIKEAPSSNERNEVVFMARSNTGKSSLLNALTNRKNLAKVSSTPGKTRLINYFSITFLDRERMCKRKAMFVDLPGFGYAKVSKEQKRTWEQTLLEFITKREQIRLFIHLIDARHPDLEIDRGVYSFLQEHIKEDQRVLRLFTKIDKLNQKQQAALRRSYPDALMVSSTKKRGLAAVTKSIYDILWGDVDGC